MNFSRFTSKIKRSLLALTFISASSISTLASAATVDLLILYDNYSSNYFGGNPQTAMNGWVNDMNAALANSQVDIKFRLVGVRHHEEDGADMGAVLGNLKDDAAAKSLRDELGADMVSQLHQKGACGVGYVAVSKEWTWNVTAPGCGPIVMLHELGHNMGLNHSRKQGNASGARYRYGVGYGVQNVFVDIMAYEGVFNTSRVSVFSNPNLSCRGYPCGVPVGNAEEAYGALALHNVRDEVAAFRSSNGGGGGTSSPVTLAQHCNYGGYNVGIGEGRYTLGDLQARGVANDDISSLRVAAGYKIDIYQHANFTGNMITKTGDDSCLVDDGWNDDASSVVVSKVNSGFNKLIQAESYFAASAGVATEATSDAGGGSNVGWINNGSWMAYRSINIPTSGTYTVEYRVAGNGGSLTLDLNGGATVLGQRSIPATGGWQNWTTVSHQVQINAGTYDFGIYAAQGGWNINWFRIKK
ncbi:hypothetical protein TDB9533_03993 [Thalassocella blandensis]|nr:hypothetical protein TDB9533_03993 [Thalassocella blandensis]